MAVGLVSAPRYAGVLRPSKWMITPACARSPFWWCSYAGRQCVDWPTFAATHADRRGVVEWLAGAASTTQRGATGRRGGVGQTLAAPPPVSSGILPLRHSSTILKGASLSAACEGMAGVVAIRIGRDGSSGASSIPSFLKVGSFPSWGLSSKAAKERQGLARGRSW